LMICHCASDVNKLESRVQRPAAAH
jgi:hypothetical protein